MTESFAQTGDIVTCENGHKIATVLNPLVSGEILRPSDFRFENGISVESGMNVEPCPICGALYVKVAMGDLVRAKLHIEGRGWVPENIGVEQ